MAGTWGVPLHVMLLLVILSSADASEDTHELQFSFEPNSENGADFANGAKSDLDRQFFQDGGYDDQQSQSVQSKWDAMKQDIHKVINSLPKRRAIQTDSQDGGEDAELSSAPGQINRGEVLRNLYHRLLIASKEKRSLYGNVLKGYKLGKREFMPYELMNEYQKRLFGSVLNNYKFGKRVPEELPANYLTGGQIYDNITDDPRERKRMYDSILNRYKTGKRLPSIGYYSRDVRRAFPMYRSLYSDS